MNAKAEGWGQHIMVFMYFIISYLDQMLNIFLPSPCTYLTIDSLINSFTRNNWFLWVWTLKKTVESLKNVAIQMYILCMYEDISLDDV